MVDEDTDRLGVRQPLDLFEPIEPTAIAPTSIAFEAVMIYRA
jgi:hypothetical protein